MTWLRRNLLLVAAVGTLTGSSGCVFTGMGLLTPVPIQPWTAERFDDMYMHKNDHRTPIMPAIRDGFPLPLCEDRPSDREVLRAMPRIARGAAYLYEEFRDDIRVRCEKIVDKIDPPRFFPLVGWAQLHHCHWKCTIYYTETIQSDYPFPVKLKKRRIQVVYIDKDHLHQYVGTDPDQQRDNVREHTDN